jgi:hypothetical protein
MLYGRVDLVPGPKREPLILEAELTEPALFLDFSMGGVERPAGCIPDALGGASPTSNHSRSESA